MLQSIVFRRAEMTLKEAYDFLRRHNYKHDKVDITPNTYRFRQHDPVPDARYATKDFPGGFFVLSY